MENEKNYILPATLLISAIMVASALLYEKNPKPNDSFSVATNSIVGEEKLTVLEEIILPPRGVFLPVRWGDLGAKLVSVGVIDNERFKALYEERGEFGDEYARLLQGTSNDQLRITENNAGYLLNLFWALGLANKNPVLDNGEMSNPFYGGAGNFASTGGWSMAKGDQMSHYSRHKFFELTDEQQVLVEKVSSGIYRPCCNNPTHFPDCNHGMAMLGLLELMASQGANEKEMWQTALAVNSYWFPNNYLTIATYMQDNGVKWDDVKPEEILGLDYSSASGFQQIASQVNQTRQQGGGGGCSV